MTTLSAASRQWASRPDDERFVSLSTMAAKSRIDRENSRSKTVSTRAFDLQPVGDDHKGLMIQGQNGTPAALSHYSFGQLCGLGKAPAGYLRGLPSELAADNLNFGLKFAREAEDVKVLLTKMQNDDGSEYVSLRAATGPNYGRIWNSDLLTYLEDNVGDGTREGGGRWQVPGEFRQQVPITKQNTTLYMGDRDFFVFLADENRGIEIPNRRNGQYGQMALGFFMWNSEVGDSTMGVDFFGYDYTCSNRNVWGAKMFKSIRLRHTASAPDKWFEQVEPALAAYAASSTDQIEQTIHAAQQAKIETDLDAFLKSRKFTKTEATAIKAAHVREEDRPIETLWDLNTAITAHAKSIGWQNERVAMERRGGEVLDLVAVAA